MAENQTQATAPTWIKLAIAVLFVLSVWALFAARSAGATAERSDQLLSVPELELTLLRGGPNRFADAFAEALEEADATDLDVDEHVWITVLLRNEGAADADDVSLQARIASPDEVVSLARVPGFQGLDSEFEEGVLSLEVGDIDTEEAATVFLGFDPEALPEELGGDWAGQYARSVDVISAHVDGSDERAAVVYGNGI